MGNLPNKNFICNYNARDYIPSTHTIPKTTGQIFDQDLVLSADPSAYTADHITINGQYFDYQFNSASDNPFNRSGSQPITIVAKTSKGVDNSGEHTIVSSRDSSRLCWLLFNPANGATNDKVFLHDNSHRYYYNTPCASITTEPNIYAIRVNNGSGYGISYTDNTTGSTMTVGYGNGSTRVGFFTDAYRTGGFEMWRGDFYWIYISTEALTDEEIQQVIEYNEGSFEISPEEMSFDYTGGTSSLSITTDGSWTASTENDWLSLSSESGSGESTITITAAANSGAQRNGIVSVTDGSNTLACAISQDKHPVLVPYNNLYINGNRIN